MNQAVSTGSQQSTSGAPLGNQNAARAKVVRDAMRRCLALRGKGDFEKGIGKIVLKTVQLAEAGEQWAVQEVFNRLEGRVAQAVEVTGANGGDLVIRDANTSLGIARRVAFVLAQGALAKANQQAKESEKEGGQAA